MDFITGKNKKINTSDLKKDAKKRGISFMSSIRGVDKKTECPKMQFYRKINYADTSKATMEVKLELGSV